MLIIKKYHGKKDLFFENKKKLKKALTYVWF